MSKLPVNTHTEWDPLREVFVGRAAGAQVPTVKDESLRAVCYATLSDEEFSRVPVGPYPERVVAESEEDLEALSATLAGLGVGVHRPQVADFAEIYRTADWAVDGCYAYCPRDTILTIGNQAIETPMTLRHRQNEARMYRHVLDTVRAPLPRLLDSIYDRSVLGRPTVRDDEPAFDAANCLKIGRDILYLVSNTGNGAGAVWLQEYLGSEYRVHPIRGVYAFQHVDSTIVPLRPGLVLLCPDRMSDENLPDFMKSWDKIYAPEPTETGCDPAWGPASKWIALNCLSLAPDLVVVEESQSSLMREFERHGLDCVPVRLRHMRTLGGGPHCVTLDVVRDGKLEDYR